MTKSISPIFCLGLILCIGIIPALTAVTDSGLWGWYGSEDSAHQITLSTGVLEQIERPIAYSNTSGAEETDMLEIRAELEPKIGESLSLLTATSGRPLYKPGSIIVRFKPDVAGSPARLAQASSAAHAQLGATVTTDYSDIGLPGMQALHLPRGVSVAEAVQIYSQNPDVLYAEPNYYYYTDVVPGEVHSQNLPAEDGAGHIPNDPEFGNLWGLHNTGQVISGRAGTVDADIDAPEAWSITTGSPDVIIAVIDTGVMYTHPDLAANIWRNPGEIPGNGIDDDHNGYIDDVYGWDFYDDDNDPDDLNGHGTHCAGTIAGVGNNAEGVAGVMWNAKIMPLRFLGADGGDTGDAIRAVRYATMMGADIISCSWGGSGYSQALKDAIDTSPALVVCAAGNEGTDNDAEPSYPSSYTSANILAVAASNNIEQLASFSNIGATSVDVAAPGEMIYSTYITPTRVTVFYDPMDSLNAWNANAPWGLNTTYYVSPPSSADDSPGGNYAPNTNAWLTAKNPIDLRGLQGTRLTFAARLELETDNDVLHVLSSPDGVGYYTHGYLTGSSEGKWRSFTVPLDMYDGDQVYIGFALQTDGFVQMDGVLIDDVRVMVIEPGPVTADYEYLSGTSMATPHVSGVAGLVRSINTSLSAMEIKDVIINTVDKKPAYAGKIVSEGRVNAYSVLNAVNPVTEPAPQANFTANTTTGPAPLAVLFTDTSTGSPTSWLWSFGDGATSAAQNPTHTYTAPGTYTVSLTATTAGGSSTEIKTDYITVTAPSPVAAFTANVTAGPAPLAVQFTDQSTGDPTSWSWSFGDGAWFNTTDPAERNATHTYTLPGVYSVNLTVANAHGSSYLYRQDCITVTPAAPFLASITVAPASATLEVGETRQFNATGYDQYGAEMPVTVAWLCSNETVGRIDNGLFTALVPGTALVNATNSTVTGSAVVTVTTSGSPKNGSIVVTANVTGAAILLDGTDTGLATVSASNVIIPDVPAGTHTVGVGSVTGYRAPPAQAVTLPAGGTVDVTFVFEPLTLAAVVVAPGTAILEPGDLQQFTATGYDQYGDEMPIVAAWSCTNESVGTIDSAGLFTALSPGTATVMASASGIVGTAAVTVLPAGPVLASITLSPIEVTLTIGESEQFSALCRDQYGEPMDEIPVTWSVDNGSVGTIDASGLFTATGAGTTGVTAAAGEIAGSANVTVVPAGPAPVDVVIVSPAAVTLDIGCIQQFTATCYDADGTLIPGAAVAWTVTDGAVGRIDDGGLFTAIGEGTTTVAATLDGVTGTATVTVRPPPPALLAWIAVCPPCTTLNVGETYRFAATGYDRFGDEVTNLTFTWSCCDPCVGTIDSCGTFTALGEGTTIVTASADGISGTACVTVRRPAPVCIELSPANVTLTVGCTQQFTATVRDQCGGDMGGVEIAWSVDNGSVGSIDSCGLFTALEPGTATVTASAGCACGTACVTVKAASVMPFADFSANVTSGIAPLAVQFTDSSTGNPTTYSWEFGDGGTSTEQNPVHTYDAAGTYTVTLTAENACGNDTCCRKGYITVTEPRRESAPNPSGGSSSRSGGGTSPSPAVRAGESVTCGGLTGSAVTSVTLTASGNIDRVMLAVEKTSLPDGVAPPDTPVYEYIEITLDRADPADIGNATIEFVVPAAWFTENNLSPEAAALLRYAGGAWQPLPTVFLGEENEYYRFQATSAGFSCFAISAPPITVEAAGTPAMEMPAVPATTTPAAPLIIAPMLAPLVLLLLGMRRKN